MRIWYLYEAILLNKLKFYWIKKKSEEKWLDWGRNEMNAEREREHQNWLISKRSAWAERATKQVSKSVSKERKTKSQKHVSMQVFSDPSDHTHIDFNMPAWSRWSISIPRKRNFGQPTTPSHPDPKWLDRNEDRPLFACKGCSKSTKGSRFRGKTLIFVINK